MGSPNIYFSYTGPLDYKQIDALLVQFRESGEYQDLQKITGKRVYSVLVECLENILNHSASCESGYDKFQPSVTVSENEDLIVINTGNLVNGNKSDKIGSCL
ncbi:MAG TPA: DUF6272 family protein, partial [Bacteroidales bacterium]|nr:DUF6272 family protein [Bacteroidales bacterium]